jgi:DNA-binding MarR family transcriptional regulator
MSMKQWMLIAAITKSGKDVLNIGELAEIIGTSYQNAKKMAVILEKQGFLTIQRSASDARAVLITLTQKCNEYFTERADIEEMFLLSIFDGIDEKTINDLYTGVLCLHENVNAQIKRT